nr:putative mediator of RNA polymerase II transcription subunit 37c [Tanacetum cinerariifolium]
GTTYSCVAAWKHNRVQIIANDQGNRTTPSYVAFNETERLVGDAAKNQAAYNPTNTIFDVKRLIGRRASDKTIQEDMKLWPFKVVVGSENKPKIVVTHKGEEMEFTSEEISSMVLAKMKEQSTKDAATVSGLEVIRMINEPTAAAISYALDKKASIYGNTNVLVFDLGGGTFDVSILTVDDNGVIEVKGTGGDIHLGGEDFDNRMVNHFVQDIKRKHKEDICNYLRALGRLRIHCERATRIISTASQTTINIDCLFNGIDYSAKFTRAKFEEVDSVDDVVLVGGSTRIPKVQDMLKELFNGKSLGQWMNPDESVACGAGILAANLSGMDITNVLILRNSPIPTKKEAVLHTVIDIQTFMRISVYQGERSKLKENCLLGEFSLFGLPSAPRGVVKATVCYEIDANGILNMIKDAERYKLEDEACVKKMKAHKALDDNVYKLKSNIKNYNVRLRLRRMGLGVKDLEDLEHQIEVAAEWLDENPDAEIDEIEGKKEELDDISRRSHLNLVLKDKKCTISQP